MVTLNGKVVIVTGASAGIGKSAAHEFAKQGARVVLAARRADVLEEVRNELAQYGDAILPVPADVVNEEDLQNLIRKTIETFGVIDVLVNNAGISLGGPFHQNDPAQIRKMVEINVYAPMRLTQLVLPFMLERKEGHIVNVGSTAGLMLSPGQTAYAPTRSAVIAFSHALRRELDGSGVRVSMVLPGFTRTAMLERMPEEEMRAAGLLNRFVTLDDPEIPARAIVDAVIRNRDQILLGGIQHWVGDKVHRLSPKLLDWNFRIFMDKDKIVQVFKDLG